MRRAHGDLWQVDAAWRVIPTNLDVRRCGEAVMGAGLAAAAAARYPDLPAVLGGFLLSQLAHGATAPVYHYRPGRLSCLPTKRTWRLSADLRLIQEGVRQLVTAVDARIIPSPVAVPLLGTGLGRLPVTVVVNFLDAALDDRFVLVIPAPRPLPLFTGPPVPPASRDGGDP